MDSIPRIGPTSVFVDASVLFAASYSPRGFARDLIETGLHGQLFLAVSEFVIKETRRNLLVKAPGALSRFEAFLATGVMHVTEPSRPHVKHVATVVVLKDAPVVAGAIVAGANLVATYDCKDLLSKRQEILEAFGGNSRRDPGESLIALRGQ
jgi:predicted nucleic acid-binding protein